MKKSVHGDDPVSQEILHFKKQREEADRVEQVFRNIRSLYNSSPIDKMRAQIEDKFMNHDSVYIPNNAKAYFEDIKKDLAQIAFDSKYLRENRIVSSFYQSELQISHHSHQQSHHQGQHGILKNPLGSKHQQEATHLLRADNISSLSEKEKTLRTSQSSEQNQLPSRSTQENLRSSQRPISAGKPSEAKLSADRSEVQLTYATDSIKVDHERTIDISIEKGRPITIKAIDDKNVLIGYDDGALKVMDTQSCSIVRQYRFASPIIVIECLDLHDPMMPVLCGTGAPGNSVISLELQKPQPNVVKHIYHKDDVSAIEVIKDGKFVSGSKDGSIALWSNETQTPLQALKQHSGKITSLATLNSFRTLLSASDDSTVCVYDIIAGEITLKNTLKEKAPVTMVKSFYGNTKFAITCLVNGMLRVWNVVDGE